MLSVAHQPCSVMALLLSKLTKLFSKGSRPSVTVKLYQAALMLKCYDHSVFNKANPSKQNIEKICDELDRMSQGGLQQYISKSLNTQVQSLFEVIEDNSDRYYAYRDRSEESAEFMTDAIGYCPYLADSTVHVGGKGVFMKGHARVGAVVAIFPGVVHLAEYVGKKNYIEKNLLPDENFFLMRRDDNVVIDARPETLRRANPPYNPFGFGHMLNHASSKELGGPSAANVIQVYVLLAVIMYVIT